MNTSINRLSIQLVILLSCLGATPLHLADAATVARHANGNIAGDDVFEQEEGLTFRSLESTSRPMPEANRIALTEIEGVDNPYDFAYLLEGANRADGSGAPATSWDHPNILQTTALVSDPFAQPPFDAPFELADANEGLSIQKDRQAAHFGIIYGLICLLVLAWGVSMTIATSRHSRLQNELILERRLSSLANDSGTLQDDDTQVLTEIERQLADHEQEMQSYRSADVVVDTASVLAKPEESAKS